MSAPAKAALITAPTGKLLPLVEPGSAAWFQRMSASKIATVLGLSPYDSRFSLWHRMAGLVPPEAESDEMRRGHYLEPAIAAWFADQHPGWSITTTGTWVHVDDDRWAATPDRLVTTDEGEVRLLECKTEGSDEKWGEEGSDEIPVYHRAQVQWQMHVTGLRVCHVGLLTSYLSFRQYVVEHDPEDVARLVPAAEEFMASLPTGPTPRRPSIDGHPATYQAVRELHPEIDGEDAEIGRPLAEKFCGARHALKAAELAEREARSELADAMGSAKRALFDGDVIATRASKQGGTPYITAARKLPTLTDQKAA
jgi:putative phage-type endonuclease